MRGLRKMKLFVPVLTLAVLLIAVGGCTPATNDIEVDAGIETEEIVYPEIVTPGNKCGRPPSNAIIIFDGKDASELQMATAEGGPVVWKIEKGYMEVSPKTGGIIRRKGFGDCHLHVEWASPEKVEGEGEGRGNSGVYLMSRYEVQILDSWNNITCPHGQAGAIYKQHPPLFNACREPGEWQSYDIFFKRPRFDTDGNLLSPGYMTVMHNGVVIQNNSELTGWLQKDQDGNNIIKYQAHPDRQPISFQDHHNPVRYRNIWVVDLE